MKTRIRGTVLLVLCCPACTADPADDVVRIGTLEISAPRIPAPPLPDSPAALYLKISNGGSRADTLDEVHTPTAARASIHRTEAGRMAHVAVVEVAAHGTLELAPGGLHGMLEQLARPIGVGDTVDVDLHFRHAGVVRLRVPVIDYADLRD